MIESVIQNIKKAISREKIVFLVGAGISFPPPSNLTTWPQLECIRALEPVKPELEQTLLNKIRPEVFFQLLKNVIGERVFTPLEMLNPSTINLDEQIVYPNYLHFFLAEMIERGHIVVTTNFDNLIETAYQELKSTILPHLILYPHEYINFLDKYKKLNKGILVKLHGSFEALDGTDTRDTIVVVLEHVQKEFPSYKENFIRGLIQNHNFIVMGYSGRDDFDIFSYLLQPPQSKSMWWFRHSNQKDSSKWEIIDKSGLLNEIENVKSKSMSLKTPKDLEIENSNAIVIGYDEGKIITSHTISFIKSLDLFKSPSISLSSKEKVEKKRSEIVSQWLETVNYSEKKEIMGDLYSLLGSRYLTRAQRSYRQSTCAKQLFVHAWYLLKTGIVEYSRRIRKSYLNAIEVLERALFIFEGINSMLMRAHTNVQLALVENRLNYYDQGTHHALNGVQLFDKLGDRFEIARALRVFSLLIMRTVPDIPYIVDQDLRNKCEEQLREAIEACEISVELFKKIGNKSGQRGEGQSLNILGLLFLRLGDYEKAVESFDKFLDLSNRSIFLEESFQAFRNLGLGLLNLSLNKPDRKTELLNRCLKVFQEAITIKGGKSLNPTSISNTVDEFITRYNRSLARKERNFKDDLDFVKKEFATLLDKTPDKKFPIPTWHWEGNVATRLCEIEEIRGHRKEVLSLARRIVKIYQETSSEYIRKATFGIQNATQNLSSLITILTQIAQDEESVELLKNVREQLARIEKLDLPIIILKQFDLSEVISTISDKFL